MQRVKARVIPAKDELTSQIVIWIGRIKLLRMTGRRRAIDPKTFEMALQLYEARRSSVQSICARLSIARRTFYRELAAHRAEQAETRSGLIPR